MPILDLNSWRDEVEAKNIFDRRHIRICGKCLVGTGRFELPTPRTPSECSTRLSHVPTLVRTRGSNGVDSEILHHWAICARRRSSVHTRTRAALRSKAWVKFEVSGRGAVSSAEIDTDCTDRRTKPNPPPKSAVE